MTCERIEQERYTDNNNYVLESVGELFWVSDDGWIRRNTCAMCDGDFVVPELVVMVYALVEDADGDDIGKMRWVERDGCSLGDRVLFLGLPASFTMDATQLGIDGRRPGLAFVKKTGAAMSSSSSRAVGTVGSCREERREPNADVL
ncbi:hypothetical protein QYE76_000985 [Lolium multiflorum]|uniref:Uncharacterized protein n=1 Tax=Lolium multiflorum TaxID=4521 RepID=A0AAD8VWH2_LOLMU|nr:hypothetical protein QYE76_000985 [Lolium multiflorum]